VQNLESRKQAVAALEDKCDREIAEAKKVRPDGMPSAAFAAVPLTSRRLIYFTLLLLGTSAVAARGDGG